MAVRRLHPDIEGKILPVVGILRHILRGEHRIPEVGELLRHAALLQEIPIHAEVDVKGTRAAELVDLFRNREEGRKLRALFLPHQDRVGLVPEGVAGQHPVDGILLVAHAPDPGIDYLNKVAHEGIGDCLLLRPHAVSRLLDIARPKGIQTA